MKHFFLVGLLLVAACSGKTVELESTNDTSQPERLCARWDASFCNSGLPQAKTLETIRLLDQVSLDAVVRLDSACLGVVAKMGRPAPPRGVDALATLKTDCQVAHDLIAPVLSSVTITPSSDCVAGASFGCVEGSFPDTCATTIAVDDQNGKYVLEADAARGALLEVAHVKAALEAIAELTGTLSTTVKTISDLDPACIPTAVSNAGDASARISMGASVSASLLASP